MRYHESGIESCDHESACNLELVMDIWRLLIHPPARGSWNMAVDEAILESVGRGEAPPTLRLYAWEPACLSLGYAQPVSDVDQLRLQARGWGIVRRPTGGSAILHADELTYAVIAPHDEPRVSGSVLVSYFRLAQALVCALRDLGLDVHTKGKSVSSGRISNPVCFEVSSAYEITVGGKKLIGSAQARRKQGVLQHGSLPLTGDLSRIVQGIAFDNEEARQKVAGRLLERATTVESALGRLISWDDTARAFVEAFHTTFNITFKRSDLIRSEKGRVESLIVEKYGHPSWIGRI